MVFHDHRLDRDPVRHASCREVLARERDRWSEVVERLVRPDPEVVEDGSDSDLLEVDAAVSHNRAAQVHNPGEDMPEVRDWAWSSGRIGKRSRGRVSDSL